MIIWVNFVLVSETQRNNTTQESFTTTLRSEIITELIPQILFRAMIARISRSPVRKKNLQKYFGAMTKWPLRKSIFESMLQEQ